MHKEAVHFIKHINNIFPEYFENKTVLDVGGGDINGNNRKYFNNCNYICNDISESPNVNCVSRTKNLPFVNNYFDTIISSECFEHDPEYNHSILKIYNLLKPGGIFFFTCASTGRPEHGTRKSKPHQSYGTINDIEDMRDYYYNLTVSDINNFLPLNESFVFWKSFYNNFSHDLYFFGIKKGEPYKNYYDTVQYIETHVTETTKDLN